MLHHQWTGGSLQQIVYFLHLQKHLYYVNCMWLYSRACFFQFEGTIVAHNSHNLQLVLQFVIFASVLKLAVFLFHFMLHCIALSLDITKLYTWKNHLN